MKRWNKTPRGSRWGDIKVEGIDEAMAELDRLGKISQSEQLLDVLLQAGKVIRDHAKRLVNLGGGTYKWYGKELAARVQAAGFENRHLRDAIFATKGNQSAGLGYLIARSLPNIICGVDRKKAPHAHLVEFGHGGPHPAPPHPYLRPAMESTKGQVLQIISDGFLRLVQTRVSLRIHGTSVFEIPEPTVGFNPEDVGWIG